MPNREVTSSPRAPQLPDHHPRVPFHTCIRLEDSSRARTSSIDAEWDALSVVSTEECYALPTVSARPRMETLPGIGTVDLPAPSVVTKPRRSAGARLFFSVLAATLASSAAFIGISAWQSHGLHSVALSLAPVALAAPATQPRSAGVPSPSSPPSPSPVTLAPQPGASVSAAIVSNAEPAPAKPTRYGTTQPRSASTPTRPSAEAPAARPVTTHSFRTRKVALAPTDNPY